MPKRMLFLSSRRGVCSGLIAVMTVIFLILLSATVVQKNNVSLLVVHQTNHMAQYRVIPNNASSFVYLSPSVSNTLQWVLIGGLALICVLATAQRSVLMLVLPTLAAWAAVENFKLPQPMNEWLSPVAVIGLVVGLLIMLKPTIRQSTSSAGESAEADPHYT